MINKVCEALEVINFTDEMKWLNIILCLVLTEGSGFVHDERIPRIGIVGGGIGGTSCAFFLMSLFGKGNVSIDIFERNKIGGRLSLVNFSQNLYEEGGSIIHSRNKYMVEFLEQFKLSKRQSPDGYFALYDGENFVFTESEWKLKTLWNVIVRYGFGFWKLKSYIEDMLKKFDRIYDLQSRGITFNTVGAMLAAMDPHFVDYLHTTSKSGFENQGISKIVVEEIIMATIRANYGQNLEIQKMVGSVSVAGATGNLWSVLGGNAKIPEKLLRASEAKLMKAVVESVTRTSSGQLEIRTRLGKDRRLYDAIVVAAPQFQDSELKINFENFDQDIRFPGRYHKTVCTLVEGSLSERYFFQKNPIVDEILTTKEDVFFNSVGRITPVDYISNNRGPPNVWKVFTRRKMNDDETSALFSNVKNKYVREWLAYPHYDASFRNDSFVLAPHLYYVNAIEWAASAMEMSAIGAKNVALLVHEDFGPVRDSPAAPSLRQPSHETSLFRDKEL